MTDKPKRGWKTFREPLRDVSALGGAWHILSELWPWIGGAVTVFWSWFADEPPVHIWVYGVVIVAALVWVHNSLVSVAKSVLSLNSQAIAQKCSSKNESSLCRNRVFHQNRLWHVPIFEKQSDAESL